jgi:hypothetical protein
MQLAAFFRKTNTQNQWWQEWDIPKHLPPAARYPFSQLVITSFLG